MEIHKNRQTLRKHDVRFETAVLVFDDPYAITQREVMIADEERWITVGAVWTRFDWQGTYERQVRMLNMLMLPTEFLL